jgi:Flp pilus assembly protein TadG
MRDISSNKRIEIPGQRRRNGESGVSLWLGIMSLVFIVPGVGLSIDVGVLYSVRTRLQSAVDGASLAAARALSIGQTLDSQQANAQQNAVNWFYANFPPGTWGTSNTSMSSGTVQVAQDANNPYLWNVTVQASTTAPVYFMRWLRNSVPGVTVAATGNASRRDVAIMMVLDRSGSMGASCSQMIADAKQFTGKFAPGRDRIGLVSFSDNVYVHSAPTTDFQNVLGYYIDSAHNGTGELDNIVCSGGTATAQAISVAYNELYKLALPGALNIIMFETDGLPNSLTLNFYDSSVPQPLLSTSSGCRDTNSKTWTGGGTGSGFKSTSVVPSWTNGTMPLATSNNSYLSGHPNNVPAGMIGEVYSDDPSQGTGFLLMMPFWQGTENYSHSNPFDVSQYLSSSDAPGCGFTSSHSSTSDFSAFPLTDIWGNQLDPSSNRYKNVTTTNVGGQTYVKNNGWTNFHNAALNAADNAAYNARVGTDLPGTTTPLSVYFFGIGLGGNGGDPPDYILMQRMANDPNGDSFNSPALYNACSTEASCVTYSDQPQGTFIFSSDSGDLGRAFLTISSQILRLSK